MLPCLVVRRALDLIDVVPLAEIGMGRARTVPVTDCKLAYVQPQVPYLRCSDDQLALLVEVLSFCMVQGFRDGDAESMLLHVQKEQKRRREKC